MTEEEKCRVLWFVLRNILVLGVRRFYSLKTDGEYFVDDATVSECMKPRRWI